MNTRYFKDKFNFKILTKLANHETIIIRISTKISICELNTDIRIIMSIKVPGDTWGGG